jgi:hypothetical protein
LQLAAKWFRLLGAVRDGACRVDNEGDNALKGLLAK